MPNGRTTVCHLDPLNSGDRILSPFSDSTPFFAAVFTDLNSGQCLLVVFQYQASEPRIDPSDPRDDAVVPSRVGGNSPDPRTYFPCACGMDGISVQMFRYPSAANCPIGQMARGSPHAWEEWHVCPNVQTSGKQYVGNLIGKYRTQSVFANKPLA